MMRMRCGSFTVAPVGKVFSFSLTAALNPTLLAAVTVMLTLLSPKRLLSGYLAGAVVASVTCGLVLVFALNGASTSSTAKHTVNPILDFGLGAVILLIAFVVGTGRDTRRQARSARKREEAKGKPPPRWKRQLSKGSARDTFLVGVLLSFPGASYIAGMDLLSKQKIGTGETVLAVIGFNLVMLLLLELPLLGYATKPDWTAATVARFNGWLSRSGGRAALIGAVVIGVALIGRGAINA
jgi:Sap, sulfolipid-1-addressing protein